ncbi:MAG: adenine-specific methyltransferase EcoRI family protein, partial [Lachnospiraceae bacterium]|nr:adenine-specific methyltransferase EcoRI family protein [Lachnospiraceae bacterium]
MAKNVGLSKAKDAKKDEFYTSYDDIQLEINHYEDKFKGKTVLCNCDDPFESNFCKFFLRNFNYLGLKRLICTSYSTSPVIGRQLTLFDLMDEPVIMGNGYVMDIKEVPMANGRGISDEDIDNLLKSKKRGVKKLKGDGDFRSDECIEYLKQADVVVTNPPFSLFREYVAQLVQYKKDFLIIGNVNAITYKEIFPLIKDNKLWLGASIHSGDRKFYVPDDYPLKASGCGVEPDGRKFIRVKGVRWFTNLDYAIRHEELVLYKQYYGNEKDYPKYDNYDAINVDKTADIPKDYFEYMGVPITYLDKHNPEQFEVVKFRKGNDDKDLTYTVGGMTIPNRTEQNRTEQNRTEQEELHLTSELSSDARCNGIMGVPITFLDKYNPDQFIIVGLDRYVADNPRYGHRFTICGRETYARIL